MRVATIDIGTNSVLLLVAERDATGALVAYEEHATITRLGEGVDKSRELLPAAVARTNACIETYAAAIRASGATRIAVVGTSAMRDAKGSGAVRDHVRAQLGVEARVISGDEEARLTFTGALSGLGYENESGAVVVFDIGGGSTEIVRGYTQAHARAQGATATGDALGYAHSFDIGSVRLTERHVRADPPSSSELAAVRDDALQALSTLPRLAYTGSPVGIAGTMTTLAAVSLRLATYDGARVHGHTLSRGELAAVVDELASVSLATRRTMLGMEPKRADVIVSGGVLALAVLDALGAASVRISDRGVRWGLAAELLATANDASGDVGGAAR